LKTKRQEKDIKRDIGEGRGIINVGGHSDNKIGGIDFFFIISAVSDPVWDQDRS